METFFYICLILLVLVMLVSAYKEYKPKIVTILLSRNHKIIVLEYQVTEYIYDKTGKKIWSKRTIRKPLFTV